MSAERRAGARIPELRRRAGLNQRDLGEQLMLVGVPGSQPRMSHLEQGEYLLTRETAAKIADILGVKTSQLLEGTDDLQVIEIRATIQDQHVRPMRALQRQRQKMKIKTDQDRERYARLEGEISYHASMIRLFESKIHSIAYPGGDGG
jgi:transcriptional regulator with XRE-family HTH domain